MDENLIRKAISALVEQKKVQKKVLIDDLGLVSLKFEMVAHLKEPLFDKCILPQVPYPPDASIAIVVKDLHVKGRDYEETIEHYKEEFRKRKIDFITEIIPLKRLKIEANGYEEIRGILRGHNVILSDMRIHRFLPEKIPRAFKQLSVMKVNLTRSDWGHQLNRSLKTAHFYVRGNCGAIKVGWLNMATDSLVANIREASNFVTKLVGGENNVLKLSIQCPNLLPIPFYFSTGKFNISKGLSKLLNTEAPVVLKKNTRKKSVKRTKGTDLAKLKAGKRRTLLKKVARSYKGRSTMKRKRTSSVSEKKNTRGMSLSDSVTIELHENSQKKRRVNK